MAFLQSLNCIMLQRGIFNHLSFLKLTKPNKTEKGLKALFLTWFKMLNRRS
jgi:hypothetical protein